MRKKIVAGNWKMNLNLQEGVALAKELNTMLAADKPNCDVVICTPFIHLATVAGELDANVIGLGAENCADKVSGAYTGEVSAAMVKSTGAQYVILGHSERRAYYGETAEILKEKTNLALENGLKVIFCIGEVLEERESGKQNEVVKAQLEGSLFDLTAEQFSNVILAYEPVWAIGTGKTATAEQAEDMHAFIRSVIAGLYPDFNREQSSLALNAYAVHKSLAGQKTVGTAAMQPRINIDGNDVSDTPWSIAVFAPSNIGLSSVNVTTASGQSFTLDAFSNDGQVGSIVTSVAEPLGKYLSEHPDDPATAFTLNGKKGKAQGKLTPAFSTATAASYNYALAKQQLRSTLINREKIERRIVIAREQAAKAAAPAVSTTEK